MFYTQLGRPLRVTTPLGPDALLLTAITGQEGISRLFRFQLEMVAPRTSSIPFEKVLGKPVTVELDVAEGFTRSFNGILCSFTEGIQDDWLIHYRAEMAPKLWLLTKHFQSRIFQQQSIPEILRAVLANVSHSLQLSGHYSPRDYCVQYRESDFDFVSRLMEEEGIFYYFDHTSKGHRMILSDRSDHAPGAPFLSTIFYEETQGGARPDARITSWEKTQQVCIGKYTTWDYSFEMPAQNFESHTPCPTAVAAGTVTHQLNVGSSDLEHYDYPGGYAKRFDGIEPGGGPRPGDLSHIFQTAQETTSIRMQEAAAGALQITATSSCPQLLPGYKLSLVRHPNADGDYLTTVVEHEARLRQGYRSAPEQDSLSYQNRLTLIPAQLPFRPRRSTARPIIAGPQTAIVVGPPGSQIFLDRYGRVKVQFHWDRQGKDDAGSSCWIRVAQVWAGNTWGAFFWPRVGHEVVVAFEEGDPDRPLIVGSVYNAANMPPLTLPDESMLGGIKSCSFQGDPSQTFNAVIFHDVPGNEYVHVHSESYQIENTESSRYQYTPQSQYTFHGSFPSL